MAKTRAEQIEYLKNLKDEDIDFSDDPDLDGTEIWRLNTFFDKAKKAVN